MSASMSRSRALSLSSRPPSAPSPVRRRRTPPRRAARARARLSPGNRRRSSSAARSPLSLWPGAFGCPPRCPLGGQVRDPVAHHHVVLAHDDPDVIEARTHERQDAARQKRARALPRSRLRAGSHPHDAGRRALEEARALSCLAQLELHHLPSDDALARAGVVIAVLHLRFPSSWRSGRNSDDRTRMKRR
jgi:hypothetical protein